ncbi:hypothetical protein RV00_GL000996 [Enterococcus devriesei]|uniref:Uncharacterized protein n=2 Tax=Enterococcus devriesei TaxID=319970 RepID=A0A1L8SPH5_9ENTE|nr:hypothetical protein RV00_GL000996 [Enterococcus devriesei]
MNGQSGYESMLMKPYEEAIEKAKGQLTESAENNGVDTSQWWKGSKKNANSNNDNKFININLSSIPNSFF